MRIAFFTPFSPELGGGSAQLRSHFRDLRDLDLVWYYLASKPAVDANPKWKWLGRPFRQVELLSDLSARTGFLPGSKARARQIVAQMQADLFWVVGHYEGVSVAAEICDQGTPLHLTVHDEPFGTWNRSSRYRFFLPLLQRTFPNLLRSAKSIDVTSWGMRNLYREEYRVNCFSVYLHVPQLPQILSAPDPQKLRVGHIGTLYAVEPFRRFVNACKQVAAENGLELEIVRIGSSAQIDEVAAEQPEIFVSHGELSEPDAIPVLASCDFCYAMYPQGKKYERFRRTSLPIKLSTYVQAQRPVFAHSPADSTLARIVSPYRIGVTCESDNTAELKKALNAIRSHRFARESFEHVRKELMGPEQVQQLGAALRGGNWQSFREYDFPRGDP